jgi:hypothetical protein
MKVHATMLPETIRVKLSSEQAGAISLTQVVVQEMPVRELVEHMLGYTGKDEARVRELLLRGTLVSGASRFRWAGWEPEPDEVAELLAKVAASHPEWDLQAVTLRHCRTQAFPLVDRQLHAAALLTADVDEGPATLRPVVLHQGARLLRAVAEELDRRACAEAEQEESW